MDKGIAPSGEVSITDDMARGLMANWKEVFPGAGFPDLLTSKALLRGALGHASVAWHIQEALKLAPSEGLHLGIKITASVNTPKG